MTALRKLPALYRVPEATHVAFVEGGDWYEWEPMRFHEASEVHAIRFADGRTWDVVNGWRQDAVADKKYS